MSDGPKEQQAEHNAEIQREIRKQMKFTLEAAVGRMAGSGAMKGQSPVSPLQQASLQIESWLNTHLIDGGGALGALLLRDVTGSEFLLNDFDHPLAVLKNYCQQILDSEFELRELVRNADVQWGRIMCERPYFEKVGAPQHPDDPYTLESVRTKLSRLVAQLAEDKG